MKDEDVYFDYNFGSDTPKKNNERIWAVLIACLVAAFGPFSFGYGMGYSSAAVVQLSDVNTTDLYLNEAEITWFGVSLTRVFFLCITLDMSALFCEINKIACFVNAISSAEMRVISKLNSWRAFLPDLCFWYLNTNLHLSRVPQQGKS